MPRTRSIKSAASVRRSQQKRSASTQAKILNAAVELIGERGLLGFSVSDVGKRAGVGRAMAGYHFRTSGDLLQAAASSLLEDHPLPNKPGLKPMLDWIDGQVQRAAEGDRRLLATLQLALGPGAAAVSELRNEYWRRQAGFLDLHLPRARHPGQVPKGVDPSDTALTLLGLLHGEQLRILTTGQPPSVGFRKIIASAVAQAASPPKVESRLVNATPSQPEIQGLFELPGGASRKPD